MTEATAHPIPQYTAAPDEAWQSILIQLREQVDGTTFNAYIRDSQAISFDGMTLTVALRSPEGRNWVASRLTRVVERHAAPLFGCPVKVSFLSMEAAAPTPDGGAGEAGEPGEDVDPADAADSAPGGEAGSTLAEAPVIEKRSPERTGGGITSPARPRPRLSMERAAVMENTPRGEDPEREPAAPAPLSPALPVPDEACGILSIEEIAGTIEEALTQPGRIVAFPRYELRHIALVGAEAFFLRLAFLQERYLHTRPDGRAASFETSVESLLGWAGVGRATLHRFKKGDPARGLQPAAGWFGIEQLPSPPRSAESPKQPPCRYRLQAGVPLTPMDADRLREVLAGAAFPERPLEALRELLARPANEIFSSPPPAPSEAQRAAAPVFQTVTSVVQAMLSGRRIAPDERAEFAELLARLSDHLTMPQQMVHVSWYFLRRWLPLIGHDMAALILYVRAQGYYNTQTHELRDEIPVAGGYSELARAVGLKRDRTVGDWLPNIFEVSGSRAAQSAGENESEKWQREQVRLHAAQERMERFMQVVPGSREKAPAGHYRFTLRTGLEGEPLTPADEALRDWAGWAMAASAENGILGHFLAWAKGVGESAASAQNDGAGILSLREPLNDGWGILPVMEMTARESGALDPDGWGILRAVLDDGAGILALAEMTAGELFKGLLRLKTFWETIPQGSTTPAKAAGGQGRLPEPAGVVVEPMPAGWELAVLFVRNGGMNPYRQRILAQESSPQAFLSWLCYAYSSKGHGIVDPFGWALARINEQPGCAADGAFSRLAARPPSELARLLRTQIESGVAPADEDWKFAFRDVEAQRLKEMASALGVSYQRTSGG